LQQEIEKHFSRQELRRASFSDVGAISYPARAREGYATDLLSHLDAAAIRERGYRIVVDYGYSAASYVLPLLLGHLGVEAVTVHPFQSDAVSAPARLSESIAHARRLVKAVDADLGVVSDRSAERIFLIDERGRELPAQMALLLFLRLLRANGHRGKVAVPVTATSRVEELAGTSLEIVRAPASLQELARAAADDGVIFAGAVGGGFVFPDFLPAYDAIASLCKLLELLAQRRARPLSEFTEGLPRSTLVHEQLVCPWGYKGTVMRVLNERFADHDVDLLDGIKVFFEGRGWALALPDPDEPMVHLYAEGDTSDVSRELATELETVVSGVLEQEEIAARS
jgi:mannose-1-phosphate guanylyltransferase/phosphomannomutase